MSDKEFKETVAEHVCEKGVAAIIDLVELINLDDLKEEYSFLLEEDKEDLDDEDYEAFV